MDMRQRLVEMAANKVTKDLMDQGKLIEAGFVIFRQLVIPMNAPPAQVEDMRRAWFAGAQHVFHSIMSAMDPGEEPTAQDMHRISQIDNELTKFADQLMALTQRAKGQG